MTDPLDAALRDRADPRDVKREELRVETADAITPEEKRSIAKRAWDVVAKVLGIGG